MLWISAFPVICAALASRTLSSLPLQAAVGRSRQGSGDGHGTQSKGNIEQASASCLLPRHFNPLTAAPLAAHTRT